MQLKCAAVRHPSSLPRQEHVHHCGGHDKKKNDFYPQKSSCNPGEGVNKIAVFQQDHSCPTPFNSKQMEILKNFICKGLSHEEFEIFLMACMKTQLDPFMKQIYAVKRKSKKPDGSWGETMTIQTGIDGYRLIAERTDRYAPGQEPSYTYDQEGNLLSATAYVKKMTADGTWHTVSASAHIDEYCQKSRDGHPIGMWNTMPRTMLAKCAESQALRRAFPSEMSGVYTKEEMEQSDVHFSKITLDQSIELENILSECDEGYRNWVYDYIKKQYSTDQICELPSDIYKRMKEAAIKNMQEFSSKKMEEQIEMLPEEVK